LFNVIGCTSKLGKERSRVWRNLSAKLKNLFSKLKLIKSYLRSTMSQQSLNGLTFLNKIHYDNLIDNFANSRLFFSS